MRLCLFSTSLNTEDFVNRVQRVDQAHRLHTVDRTTRPRRPSKCMLSVVNHYACMALRQDKTRQRWNRAQATGLNV